MVNNQQNYDFDPQFRNDYNVANDGVIKFATTDFENSKALSNSSIIGNFTDKDFYRVSSADANSGAFWVKEDGEISTYKAPIESAELYPTTIGSIETASIMQDYMGKNSFLINRPNSMKNAIMQKFDAAALFGIDEPTEFNGQTARSVSAKAGVVSDVKSLMDAYSDIAAKGGRPVIVAPSKLTLMATLIESLKGEQSALATLYQSELDGMNIVEVAPQIGSTSLRNHGTVLVYDANLLYTAFSDNIRAETFNTGIVGSLKPMDGMKDGFGTANAGVSANGETGMNLLTRAKEAVRVLAFGDYSYAGVQDKSAAKLVLGEEIATTTNTDGTASDFYKDGTTPDGEPATDFDVENVTSDSADIKGK